MGAISNTNQEEQQAIQDDLLIRIDSLSTSDKPMLKKLHGVFSSVYLQVFLSFLFPFLAVWLRNKLVEMEAVPEQVEEEEPETEEQFILRRAAEIQSQQRPIFKNARR